MNAATTDTWTCPGTVVRCGGGQLSVAVEAARCAGCTNACGVATTTLRLDSGRRAWRAGEDVVLSMPRGPLRRAVAALFGCPLAGLLAGAAWSTVPLPGDPGETAAVGLGLLAGVLAGVLTHRGLARAVGVEVSAASDAAALHASRNVEEWPAPHRARNSA